MALFFVIFGKLSGLRRLATVAGVDQREHSVGQCAYSRSLVWFLVSGKPLD